MLFLLNSRPREVVIRRLFRSRMMSAARSPFDYLRELPGKSEVKKKTLITIFVHSVHLYDDYYTIIFNAGNAILRSENIPIKSIENSLMQAVFQTFSGSDFDAFVPPDGH